RNAVAHGIEGTAQRLAAGKPPEGRITLEVLRRGRRVTFRCSDDGAGVDVDAVRRAAQRKGLLASAAPSLDAQALLALLLRGGLSTTGTVTEVSGRGIGLDVVREVVERLGATAKIVLRPLPELAPPSPLVAGASLDVEGHPRLVLDPEGLVLHAQRAGAIVPPPEHERMPVLVIDDSLTTRMLEQSILESAGYEVHAAVSAEDALAQARRRAYALFLVDV